ncbi:MAG: DUF4412 domain-containing protein [Acidobacteriales bacterium]|nr:DUF4412 domain-containing protein [Terriglobales bacterium]
MAVRIHDLVIFVALMAASLAPAADVKLKTRMTMGGGMKQESTVYIQGARQRTEFAPMMPGMAVTTILQCDLNRSVQLNDAKKLYLITPLDVEEAASPKSGAAAPKKDPASKGGVVKLVQNVQDTGERKKMFGYEARHIKATTSTQASPDACAQADVQIEADGWYADISPGLGCESVRPPRLQMGRAEMPQCQDRFQVQRTGNGKLGYPLEMTITYKGKGGNDFITTTETLELSPATLDKALFEIPPGYTEAKSYREMMPSMREMMRGAEGLERER